MGILTEDMQRVVEFELGFIATVCPDGTPNLSPKGTTAVWDDDHLVFADIRSPGTVENLRTNPSIEINVVDGLVRKGYRFKGTATVHTDGEVFERGVKFYEARGTQDARGPHPRDRDRVRRTRQRGDITRVRHRRHRGRAARALSPTAHGFVAGQYIPLRNIVARISSTMSSVVSGCRNARRATVSPCQRRRDDERDLVAFSSVADQAA